MVHVFISDYDGLKEVSVVVEKHTSFSFDVTVVPKRAKVLSWPLKVNKGDHLIDLRALKGWSKKRDQIIGPFNFVQMVKKTIVVFVPWQGISHPCYWMQTLGHKIKKPEILLLWYLHWTLLDFETKFNAGILPTSIDLSQFTTRDPYRDLVVTHQVNLKLCQSLKL